MTTTEELVFRLRDEAAQVERENVGWLSLPVSLRDAADRLSLLSEEVEARWQPIETAPKDGTEVVLWCGQPVCGRISTDHLDPERTPQGWTMDVTWPGMIEPTHWMPLPSAPSIPSGRGE